MKVKLPVYHFSILVALAVAVAASLLILLSGCSSTPKEPYGDWRDYNQVDWSPGPEPTYRLMLGESE